MTSSEPGKVFARLYAGDEEVTKDLLKSDVDLRGMPDKIHQTGLDATRQWYLYNEVAPLCHNSSPSCPEPAVPKPKKMKV